MTDHGLSAQDLEKILSVFERFPEIREVILYGSRALGKYRPGSDIDLTIRSSSIEPKRLNQLRTELEALSTPYTFDLSVFEELQNSDLIEHIRRVGKKFFSQVD
jgi:uncharacterized protein